MNTLLPPLFLPELVCDDESGGGCFSSIEIKEDRMALHVS